MNRNSPEARSNEHRPSGYNPNARPPVKVPVLGLVTLGIVTPIVLSGGAYAVEVIKQNMPSVTTDTEVTEVQAVVKDVNVEIEPITISTLLADTETKVEQTDTLNALGLEIPVNHTELIRTASVKGEYTFDPEEVTASYDTDGESVTITVPSTAFGTDVSVNVSRTIDYDDVGIKWLLDDTQTFLQRADGIFDAAGIDADLSKDTLLSGVTAGTLGVQETMEIIADDQAASAVDASCSEAVETIPGFTDALTTKVTQLAVREVVASSFLDELDLPSGDRRELITDATIVFEGGEKFDFQHDQELADRVAAYNEIFSTTATVDPVACGVDENSTFTIDGQPVSEEVPNEQR